MCEDERGFDLDPVQELGLDQLANVDHRMREGDQRARYALGAIAQPESLEPQEPRWCRRRLTGPSELGLVVDPAPRDARTDSGRYG